MTPPLIIRVDRWSEGYIHSKGKPFCVLGEFSLLLVCLMIRLLDSLAVAAHVTPPLLRGATAGCLLDCLLHMSCSLAFVLPPGFVRPSSHRTWLVTARFEIASECSSHSSNTVRDGHYTAIRHIENTEHIKLLSTWPTVSCTVGSVLHH